MTESRKDQKRKETNKKLITRKLTQKHFHSKNSFTVFLQFVQFLISSICSTVKHLYLQLSFNYVLEYVITIHVLC